MEPKSNTYKLKRRKIWTRNNTIPVIVDNIVNLPGYNMVRFVYFSIDATENPKPFKLKAKNQVIPFLLIGFQGIIHSPLKGTRFLSPETIGRLFNTIEETGEFFVDTNDIWMPLSMFPQTPPRGDVFRITKELFSLALKYRHDKIELEAFIPLAEKFRDETYHSVNESKAFNAWSQSVIQEAKEIYPKNDKMKLELNMKYE